MFLPTDKLYKTIGENIQRLRSKRDMSQDELAQKVDLVRTSITNIEKGKQKIQIHTLFQIASALGVLVTDLLPTSPAQTPDIDKLLEQQSLHEDSRDAVLRVLGKK